MHSQHQLCQICFGVDEFKELLITLEEKRELGSFVVDPSGPGT